MGVGGEQFPGIKAGEGCVVGVVNKKLGGLVFMCLQGEDITGVSCI